jgi:methylase of polypeptide subunit release factors
LIEYFYSDLFSGLGGRRFDVIAWNPPFFPKAVETPADAAWYAGENYEVISRFARESRRHLESGGVILLILSLDASMGILQAMFEAQGFSVRRRVSKKWGFGETMVILEIQ